VTSPSVSKAIGVIVIFATVGLIMVIARQQSEITGIEMRYPNGGIVPVKRLDYNGWATTGNYHYTFEVIQRTFSSTQFRISGYECIESLQINGQTFDLSELSHQERCAYGNGFVADLGPYLTPGSNLIEAEVSAPRGYLRFEFVPVSHNRSILWLIALAGLLWACALWFSGLSPLGGGRGALILGVALVVRLLSISTKTIHFHIHQISSVISTTSQRFRRQAKFRRQRSVGPVFTRHCIISSRANGWSSRLIPAGFQRTARFKFSLCCWMVFGYISVPSVYVFFWGAVEPD
jgi:hypothetical protein